MMVLDKFTREDYKKILEKIPTEGILYATMSYYTNEKKEVAEGWRSCGITKEEICYVRMRKKDTMCPPVAILDFPVIKPNCDNIEKICIDTDTYRYEIKSTQICIYGPEMPFTPAELVASGVNLRSAGFVYTWRPEKWNMYG